MHKVIDRVASALITGITYKEAWSQLYNALGERMQNEEQELMDSVLQGVKLDFKERQDAIQNQTAE